MHLGFRVKKTTCGLIWKSVLLFFYIYDIALQGIPTKLSTRKIAFAIFFMLFLQQCLQHNKKIRASQRVIGFYALEFVVCAFSLLHVFARAMIYGFEHSIYAEYPYVVYFIIFGLLAPICMAFVFRNIEEFLNALILSTIYQSIFVILEFWIWPMRIWLSQHIYTTANVLYTHAKRATGLGASGAQLSVWLFFGVFACSYFLITRKKRIKYWGIILLIFTAQFLSGRTGLYLGIADVLLIGLYLNKDKKVLRNSMIKIGIGGIVAFVIVLTGFQIGNIEVKGKASVLKEAINRNTKVSRIIGENGFFGRFLEDEIPPLDENTLLGYGVTGGELTKNLSCQHDSGFVKRYIADGLIMAIFEYAVFFLLLFNIWKSIKNKGLRRYTAALVLLPFVIEIKEPFMYYYSGTAVTICIFILALQNNYVQRISNGNKNDEKDQCYCSSI